jgi:hypothetical protein
VRQRPVVVHARLPGKDLVAVGALHVHRPLLVDRGDVILEILDLGRDSPILKKYSKLGFLTRFLTG